jgi:hypothetical protein
MYTGVYAVGFTVMVLGLHSTPEAQGLNQVQNWRGLRVAWELQQYLIHLCLSYRLVGEAKAIPGHVFLPKCIMMHADMNTGYNETKGLCPGSVKKASIKFLKDHYTSILLLKVDVIYAIGVSLCPLWYTLFMFWNRPGYNVMFMFICIRKKPSRRIYIKVSWWLSVEVGL